MLVRDIMQTPMPALYLDSTLRDAAFVFRQHHIQGTCVHSSTGELVGVFTHKDFLQALAQGADMEDFVCAYLKPFFCTVRPDDEVSRIDWQGSRFLAVMDRGQLVGGLDTSVVLKAVYGSEVQKRHHYRDYFQGVPEPIYLVDRHWRVDWHNDAAGFLYGPDCPQFQGRRLAEVLMESGFKVELDPMDNESVYMATKASVRLLAIVWPVPGDDSGDGFMVLLRNVQDQVVRSRELMDLKDLSKELHAIIDSSFDGFFITDGEGRTLRINKAYERITGIRTKEVLGRTMAELVEAGFYNESVTLKVLQSRTTETIIQRVKNTKIIVVTGTPVMDADDNIWRVVTNVRDVTELKNLQAELERMSRLQTQYQRELDSLRRHVEPKPRIVIRSKKMKEVYDQALRLAKVDSSVLLLGESGVGKEVVAELLHRYSVRRDKPFIKVSCAAIPEHLLESELFGYMPGAFTGALKTGKEGVFEEADKGTLFLDEIGEMPLGLQAKMLRVLQDKTFSRVGGIEPITVDVRIVTATNRDLVEMVENRLFRRDLYYRLNVVPLCIPPLRERREGIFDLIYHFLGIFNEKHGFSRQLETDALDELVHYDWPGNVRQLENTVERLVVMARGDLISQEDVHRALDGNGQGAGAGVSIKGRTLREILADTERQVLSSALQNYSSTRRMAKVLGVNQSTVVRKINRYGLNSQ